MKVRRVSPEGDYTYFATVSRWVDGDSVWMKLWKEFELDIGFRIMQQIVPSTEQNFRLHGINTPELRGDTKVAGLRAMQELQHILGLGTLTVRTEKTGKYGRYLVHIYVKKDDGPLYVNEEMLKTEWAVPYGDPIPEGWSNVEE